MSFNFPDSPTEGQIFEAIPGGTKYVFRNGQWMVESVEAPIDGKTYGRKNATWSEVASQSFADAPADNRFFMRRNNAWLDGKQYAIPMLQRSYQLRTETVEPPNSGEIRLNAAVASATLLFIHKTDLGTLTTEIFPQVLQPGGIIGMSNQALPATAWNMFRIVGALVDSSTYWTLPVAFIAQGSFAIANGTRGDFVIMSLGGGGGVSIGDAAPASPVAGQLWWNSTSGNTYVYYDDGDSQQWVQIAGSV